MPVVVFHNEKVAHTLGVDCMDARPTQFHSQLPGYRPTPLIEATQLASTLGIGRLWIKDESERMGLPAFKILGASWAVYRVLLQRLGGSIGPWATIDELRAWVAPLRPITLAAATDGNHGRAVARMAALLGFDAHIFVPEGTVEARINAIASEGARVTVVHGSYDEAVDEAAQHAGEHCLVIADTAWPGYENVPQWVIDGYSTILHEIDQQLTEQGASSPDLVLVQIGVGALAAAVTRHYRCATATARPTIVGVEPLRAACVLRSMEAGQIVEVPGPHDSIMAGLNCGTPSLIAWPLVSAGIDLFVAVDDERARQAMRALASAGLVSGETGAAGLAGLLEVLGSDQAVRDGAGIRESSNVLLISTEGATDPVAYQRIVGPLQAMSTEP